MAVASPIPTDREFIHAPPPSGSVHTEFLRRCLSLPHLSHLFFFSAIYPVLVIVCLCCHQPYAHFIVPYEASQTLYDELYTNKRDVGLFLVFLMLFFGEVNEPWRGCPSVIVTFIAVSLRDGTRLGKTDDAPRVILYYLKEKTHTWEIMIGQFTLFLHWSDSNVALFSFFCIVLYCMCMSHELCFSIN